ncbi:unnamed protein product [Closterium sp. NIES-65]|nr:unnamed protein product [Closterium sp. NIES-65]
MLTRSPTSPTYSRRRASRGAQGGGESRATTAFLSSPPSPRPSFPSLLPYISPFLPSSPQVSPSRIQVRSAAADSSSGHGRASREAQAAKEAMEMLWRSHSGGGAADGLNQSGVNHSGGVSHGGMQQAHAQPLSMPGGGFEYGEEEGEGAGPGGFTPESVRSLLEALELEAAEESKHALSIVDRVLWVDKRVRDYMTPNPICLHRDMSLRDAAQVTQGGAGQGRDRRIFLRHRISGAPVVEVADAEDGGVGLSKVVGVLSQRDIMWKELRTHGMVGAICAEEEFLRRLANYQDHLNQGPRVDKLRQHLRKAASLRVAELVTDTVLQVQQLVVCQTLMLPPPSALKPSPAPLPMCCSVEESMTDTVLQVEEDSFMVDATEIMLNCNVRTVQFMLLVSRLPVVARLPDGRRTLTGIITCSDILRHTLLLL